MIFFTKTFNGDSSTMLHPKFKYIIINFLSSTSFLTLTILYLSFNGFYNDLTELFSVLFNR